MYIHQPASPGQVVLTPLVEWKTQHAARHHRQVLHHQMQPCIQALRYQYGRPFDGQKLLGLSALRASSRQQGTDACETLQISIHQGVLTFSAFLYAQSNDNDLNRWSMTCSCATSLLGKIHPDQVVTWAGINTRFIPGSTTSPTFLLTLNMMIQRPINVQAHWLNLNTQSSREPYTGLTPLPHTKQALATACPAGC